MITAAGSHRPLYTAWTARSERFSSTAAQRYLRRRGL